MKFSILLILLFQFSVGAQTGGEKTRDEFERKFAGQAAFISECRETIRSRNNFGLNIKPAIIAGYELNGGHPIRLPKPEYPNTARRYRFFGAVSVEVFLDENGNAVYARAKSGRKIFYKNAEIAASNSQFRAVGYCEKKILQKKIIVYNFLLN